MRTVDGRRMRAPLPLVYRAATAVERWPELLPHYRWVRRRGREADADVVEMAAWRPFGFLKYPTWWVSHMWADPEHATIRYRHVEGITRAMEVEWRLVADGEETDVTIVHEWEGPAWPIIRRPAAEWIIGPVFIHHIASRTLAGLGHHVEGLA